MAPARLEKVKTCLCRGRLREMMLPGAILLGALVGVGLGVGLRSRHLTKVEVALLFLPGDIMIQLMKMLLIPITMSSIIVSMARLDLKSTGKIGARALIYYFSTLVVACAVGISVSLAITPQAMYVPSNHTASERGLKTNPGVSFTDMLRNMFPENLIEAAFRKKESLVRSVINTDTNDTEEVIDVRTVEGINLLGLLIFAVILGLVLGSLEQKGRPLFEVFNSLYLACIKLIRIFIWYVPIGVAFLIAANIVKIENPIVILTTFGHLFGILVLALFIHGFIILPLIYLAIVRRNPFRFCYNMIPAISTALATESSAATIPVSMQCLEETNKVDPRIVRMIVPIGATINMDGTCLYANLFAIFISYLHGTPVNVGQIFVIALTAISMSVGVPGVPMGGGGNTEMAVLSSVGLPTGDVYIVLAMHWLMGRLRTVINILGDAYGCGIVEKLSSGDLEKMSYSDCNNTDRHVKSGSITAEKDVVDANLRSIEDTV